MIYDALGRLVKTFNDLKEHTGQIVWDGKDLEHNKLAQGVYFIELQTPEGSIVEKAVLLK
jgi:flagellar hook assembly protein FlgD